MVRYDPVPFLQTMKTEAGNTVLINPEFGSWVKLNDFELYQIKTGIIGPRTGEKLFRYGMVYRITNRGREFVFRRRSGHNIHHDIRFFELSVTMGCNLSCRYCQYESGPDRLKEKASKELGRLWVDKILDYRKKVDRYLWGGRKTPVTLEFTGGEPLTNMSVVEATARYARDRFAEEGYPESALNLVIQSNATLLNRKNAEILKKYRIRTGISIDGPKELNDAMRVFPDGSGTFDIIMKNLKNLNTGESGTGISGVIAVIGTHNVGHIEEVVRFCAEELKVSGISLNLAYPMGRGKEFKVMPDVGEFLRNYRKAIIYLQNLYLARGKLVVERELLNHLAYLTSQRRFFMCQRSPCGGGLSICSTIYNGDVFPCNESVYPELKMINLYEQDFIEMTETQVYRKYVRRQVHAIPECSTCTWRSICQSRCTVRSYLKYGDFRSKSAMCKYERGLIRMLISMMADGVLKPEFVRAVGMAAQRRR